MLSQATLKTLLLTLPLGITEPPAVEAWAEAFTAYFEDAVSTPGSIPVIVAALRTPTTGPKDAMKTALTGQLKTTGAALQAGIQAFWAVINLAPALFFTGAILPSTPPAGLTTLGATLLVTGTANTAQVLDKDTAVGNIAADIHTAHTAQAGGTFTLPGPTVETIT